jgi:hypothetical protein
MNEILDTEEGSHLFPKHISGLVNNKKLPSASPASPASPAVGLRPALRPETQCRRKGIYPEGFILKGFTLKGSLPRKFVAGAPPEVKAEGSAAI